MGFTANSQTIVDHGLRIYIVHAPFQMEREIAWYVIRLIPLFMLPLKNNLFEFYISFTCFFFVFFPKLQQDLHSTTTSW